MKRIIIGTAILFLLGCSGKTMEGTAKINNTDDLANLQEYSVVKGSVHILGAIENVDLSNLKVVTGSIRINSPKTKNVDLSGLEQAGGILTGKNSRDLYRLEKLDIGRLQVIHKSMYVVARELDIGSLEVVKGDFHGSTPELRANELKYVGSFNFQTEEQIKLPVLVYAEAMTGCPVEFGKLVHTGSWGTSCKRSYSPEQMENLNPKRSAIWNGSAQRSDEDMQKIKRPLLDKYPAPSKKK